MGLLEKAIKIKKMNEEFEKNQSFLYIKDYFFK
jgi:hypothetical protein